MANEKLNKTQEDSKKVKEEFETVEINYQEVEPIKKEIRTDSYFDGGLIELIGWRLLATIITIVTLGIASPWASCMLYNYQIKHTVYNGKRLKFVGTGGDLFVNNFKWVLLSIVTLGIYLWFIPVKKTKWVISNIHFEDEEYKRNESFFDGKTIQLIGVNLLCNILNIMSFGFLYPFTVCFKLRWINKHTIINRKKLIFKGKAISLFGKYILWIFLTMITFGIYGWWLSIKMLKWQSKNTCIKVVGEEDAKDKSLFIAIPIILISIIVFLSIVISLFSKIDFDKPFFGLTSNNGSTSGVNYDTGNNGFVNDAVMAPVESIKKTTKKTTTKNKSKCPSGYYYFEYHKKCAKNVEMNGQECMSKGGDPYTSEHGVDMCTLYLN